MTNEVLPRHSPYIVTARNANDALHTGLWWLATAGVPEESRNGPVLVAPGPVISHYTRPQERVLFSALRDANPFFHMYEAVWMLAGRNDAESVGRFAKTMESFADDGGTLNGAYGHRWRRHFGYDQLLEVVKELTGNHKSRRVVLTMWDPNMFGDVYKAQSGSKDVPCNTQVYFGIDRHGLNMSVTNRSNDMVWGGYGANYVHMGLLQEVLAAAIGVKVGSYFQISNNFHVYPERPDTKRLISQEEGTGSYNVLYQPDDRYDVPVGVSPFPMFPNGCNLESVLGTAERLAEDPLKVRTSDGEWFGFAWMPMMEAHLAYKNDEIDWAVKYLKDCCSAKDWAIAAIEWLGRRRQARQEKGVVSA